MFQTIDVEGRNSYERCDVREVFGHLSEHGAGAQVPQFERFVLEHDHEVLPETYNVLSQHLFHTNLFRNAAITTRTGHWVGENELVRSDKWHVIVFPGTFTRR